LERDTEGLRNRGRGTGLFLNFFGRVGKIVIFGRFI
jgi:hypothetical protein